MLLRFLILLFINLYVSNAYSAEYFTIEKFKCNISKILIKGDIEINEFNKFKNFIDNVNKIIDKKNCISDLEVELDSEGGNVDESMKIGRYIRDNKWWTSVDINHKCFSSCIFIFAGGTYKEVSVFEKEFEYTGYSSAKIGIHRPYFSALKDGLSSNEIRILREKRNFLIRQYLDEMDISSTLLEDMLAISPEEIKIITEKELKSYRLIGWDANVEEQKIAKYASFYKITSAEYRKRDALSDSNCSHYIKDIKNRNIEEFHFCSASILWNIKYDIYKRKYPEIQNCAKSQKNRDVISKCIQDVIFNQP